MASTPFHSNPAMTPSGTERLTKRQLEILKCLGLGMPYKAVAELNGIAESTIKGHATAIYKRLGAICLVDALREMGWLIIPE